MPHAARKCASIAGECTLLQASQRVSFVFHPTRTAMKCITLLPTLLLYSVLHAQSTCDSIQVERMRYDPFGNGLQVTLFNGSVQFLNGPTVDVLDADGLPLGIGTMEFFGVLPGSTSQHRVAFMPQPSSPFSGIVRLNYTGVEGTMSCLWSLADMQLCPMDSCMPLGVYAYQQGGNNVAMDIDWSVRDQDNVSQANGVLHMDVGGFGYAVEELCLPPGAYTLQMTQTVAAGNLIQVGMTQNDFAWTDGTNTQLPPGGSVVHPFDFFALCVDGTQGLSTSTMDAPVLVVDGRTVRITASTGTALGKLIVMDVSGRIVRNIATQGNSITVDLTGCAAGTYLLRSLNAKDDRPVQRFVLP
jgi:hypothetical protein